MSLTYNKKVPVFFTKEEEHIQPFLEEHKNRLEFVFLPSYSPEMKLFEGLWKRLKNAVIYNVFHASVREIRKHVQAFISSIN